MLGYTFVEPFICRKHIWWVWFCSVCCLYLCVFPHSPATIFILWLSSADTLRHSWRVAAAVVSSLWAINFLSVTHAVVSQSTVVSSKTIKIQIQIHTIYIDMYFTWKYMKIAYKRAQRVKNIKSMKTKLFRAKQRQRKSSSIVFCFLVCRTVKFYLWTANVIQLLAVEAGERGLNCNRT